MKKSGRGLLGWLVVAVAIACGGGLVGGCGGGEAGSGYLDGTGCVELEYTQFDWDTWGWGWQCGDKGYSATCKLEHHMKGVNITCDCIVSEGGSFSGSGGKLFSQTGWNDNMPPTDPYMFVEYVQNIPQCATWAPPF